VVEAGRYRVFLVSPASASGERARLLLGDRGQSEIAATLRREGAPLGEVFSFLSGLYFRGKLEYARTFAAPPPGVPGTLIITAGRGLITPETPITLEDLRRIATVPVDETNVLYRGPLEEHARTLAETAGPDCDFVLLGSVATAKYLEPLFTMLGDRLLFPEEFIGRGDMSRGGLMLRCVRSGEELRYVPAGSATYHGKRPPRLPGARGS
jgi:hypothetical protein